nr:RNA-directed DNA polymerase, eukaryota [Tanacetum cinerariifolium]
MSLVKEWDDSIAKLKKKLSKWKLKTLSVGGRLTLLKAVLGSTPIYNMSLFKVPKQVLNSMERMRRSSLNGFFSPCCSRGPESHQLSLLTNLLDTVILSNMEDIWFFDLNGDDVAVASLLCPLCDSGMEDAAHLFFRCDMAKDVMFLVSRWWDLEDRRIDNLQRFMGPVSDVWEGCGCFYSQSQI